MILTDLKSSPETFWFFNIIKQILMKKHFNFFSLFLFITIVTSCSNNDESETILENPKSVTDCGFTNGTDNSVFICIDGTNDALPNEIIKFASSFYSKNDKPSDAQFFWTVESGNMEILKVENSIDGSIAKSIVTVKFNSNFNGKGKLGITAKSKNASGITEHFVELGK